MDTLIAASGPGKDAYGATIFDFAMLGGRFVALTMDAGFVELIKTVVFHGLGISKKSFIHFTRLDDLFDLLHREFQSRFIICLERTSAGTNIAQVMDSVTRICPSARIIVLTQEIDQYTTALLVEQGAHNLVTKPISIASFTEKLAFTIAPQGKLSKLIDKGKKLLDSENWGEALLVAEEILDQKKDSAVGYMIKGDAFKGLDMLHKAEDMYARASQSAELYLAPLKRLAALHEQAGNTEKQLQCLRRLNEISPLNTERIMRIGELEIDGGNVLAAEEMFQKVMDIARQEAADHLSSLSSQIADICLERSPEMAAKYSKRALDIKGSGISALDLATVNTLGISLRKQGKWKEAIAEYRRVLEAVPDNAGLIYNMAMAFSEGRELGKAYAMVCKALEIDPDLPASGKNVAFNIGSIFQKAGHDGTVFFKKAYDQDPNDKRLWEAFKRSQAQQRTADG